MKKCLFFDALFLTNIFVIYETIFYSLSIKNQYIKFKHSSIFIIFVLTVRDLLYYILFLRITDFSS